MTAGFPALGFDLHLTPDVDLETWRLSVPAQGACFVLEDAEGRPQLLATTGNLRNTLVRRFSDATAEGPAPRTDYRAVIRRVRYRPVFSRFEANWVYLENARRLYPRSYRKLVRHRRAAWVRIDLSDAHPRFVAIDTPAGPPETCFGPLPTARSARAYVQTLEDLFDLCREHTILTQAPRGVACSYKQMGRCRAACDGSITMQEYREQLRGALAFLAGGQAAWIHEATLRMRRAAGELRFEQAALLKSQIDKARSLSSPATAHLAPLTHQRHVILQRGSRKGRARVFISDRGHVEFVGEMLTKWRQEQLAWLGEYVGQRLWAPAAPADDLATERMNLVGWHLVGADRDLGVYLSADAALRPGALNSAWDDLLAKLAARHRTNAPVHEQQ